MKLKSFIPFIAAVVAAVGMGIIDPTMPTRSRAITQEATEMSTPCPKCQSTKRTVIASATGPCLVCACGYSVPHKGK